MMRNMKLSENNFCVCLSVFARKGLGVLAVAAFLLFAAGASVTKATSVDLIFNPNMAGNAITSATPCTGDAGPSGPWGCDNQERGLRRPHTWRQNRLRHRNHC